MIHKSDAYIHDTSKEILQAGAARRHTPLTEIRCVEQGWMVITMMTRVKARVPDPASTTIHANVVNADRRCWSTNSLGRQRQRRQHMYRSV